MKEETSGLRETVHNLAIQVAVLTQAVERDLVVPREARNLVLRPDRDQDLLRDHFVSHAVILGRQRKDLLFALVIRTVGIRRKSA